MCEQDSAIFASDEVVLIKVEYPEHQLNLLFKRAKSKQFESIDKLFLRNARKVLAPIFRNFFSMTS